MKFSTELLKEILPGADFSGVSINNKSFSFLNIAVPNGEISQKIDRTSTLYFPVYATDVQCEGWYDNDFDRRNDLSNLVKENPDWTFIIDRTCPNISAKKAIIVSDIFETIEAIYEFVLNKANPRVIGVTGSVGKTTTVAMLEFGISTQEKCLRIYSKRITPLILWSIIINFLDSDIGIIVIEMSFYRRAHIKWLVANLNPNISIILNIAKNHLGIDAASIDEIVKAKSEIIISKSIPIINYDDKWLKKEFYKHDQLKIKWFSVISDKSDFFIKHVNNDNFKVYYLNTYLCAVDIFVATNLSVYQMYVTLIVSQILKLDISIVANSISSFNGRENRLVKRVICGRRVIFDGEISYTSRLLELSKNFYAKSALLVAEFDFGQEPVEVIANDIAEALSAFEIVRISDKANIPNEIHEKIIESNLANVSITSRLFEGLDKDAMIFYHHGGYFMKKSTV